jgi:uncharacterized protein YbjT (DUF2867 family)
MEAEKKTIVVVGATGRQGSAVIKHLLNSGSFRVRALTRNARAARAEHLRALGVELLEASLDDSAGLERSLEGADGVFSIQNYWEKGVGFEGEIRQGENLAAAAKKARVKHFVQSTMADGQIPYPVVLRHFQSKARLEESIDAMGLPRTFLGTVTFMDNILDPKFGGGWTFPFISRIMKPGVPYHMLAVDDIGGVAAAVLADPEKYIGRKINMASESPTVPEMKRIYREVTGRSPKPLQFPVRLSRIMNHEFVAQLEWQSAGGWTFGTDEASTVYPKLTSFREFLRKHQVTNL